MIVASVAPTPNAASVGSGPNAASLARVMIAASVAPTPNAASVAPVPNAVSLVLALIAPNLALALIAASLALALIAPRAPAQDFASPAPPARASSPAAFLERALPTPGRSLAAEVLESRWYEVPGLTTRAAALAAGWRSIRAAAGISRTGDRELGWSTGALALGVAGKGAGGALRAAARRDCDPGALEAALGPGAGLEVGGGAWVEAGMGVTLSASAPQLFTRGVSPPLERGLEIGAAWVIDDLSLRLARLSARGGAGAAQHEAGFALSAGPLTVWLEARDQPARGALGLAARAGVVSVAGVVESHPLLGETVRISLALARPPRDGGRPAASDGAHASPAGSARGQAQSAP